MAANRNITKPIAVAAYFQSEDKRYLLQNCGLINHKLWVCIYLPIELWNKFNTDAERRPHQRFGVFDLQQRKHLLDLDVPSEYFSDPTAPHRFKIVRLPAENKFAIVFRHVNKFRVWDLEFNVCREEDPRSYPELRFNLNRPVLTRSKEGLYHYSPNNTYATDSVAPIICKVSPNGKHLLCGYSHFLSPGNIINFFRIFSINPNGQLMPMRHNLGDGCGMRNLEWYDDNHFLVARLNEFPDGLSLVQLKETGNQSQQFTLEIIERIKFDVSRFWYYSNGTLFISRMEGLVWKFNLFQQLHLDPSLSVLQNELSAYLPAGICQVIAGYASSVGFFGVDEYKTEARENKDEVNAPLSLAH
jgi:hypothetical protein